MWFPLQGYTRTIDDTGPPSSDTAAAGLRGRAAILTRPI